MARKTQHPSSSSFTAGSNKEGHTLVLTAMSVGKLLCLLHILEAFFEEQPTPKRPKRPAPKFVTDRPMGHSPYLILTQLGPSAVAVLIKACEDYQEAYVERAKQRKIEQEQRMAELGPQPETGRRTLVRVDAERHILVDEFLDFLKRLYAPRDEVDPTEGPHMLAQVRQLIAPYQRSEDAA